PGKWANIVGHRPDLVDVHVPSTRPLPDAKMVGVPGGRIEYEAGIDELLLGRREDEIDFPLPDDVHEAAVAGDHGAPQAGSDSDAVENRVAGDGEVRACTDDTLEIEVGPLAADPLHEIQRMDDLTRHAARRAPVVDPILAPAEVRTDELQTA